MEPDDTARALQTLDMQAAPGIEDLFRAGAALCTGKPFAPSPKFLLTYLGGPQAQGRSRAPDSADPLEKGYGFYFLWVTCPATGGEVTEAVRLVTDISAQHGMQPQLTVQLPNGRAAVLVVRLCFDRDDRAQRARVSRCYEAVLKSTVDAGFPPWRLGIEGMPLLQQCGIDMTLARRLKARMDPDTVLAPGRYVG